VSTVRRALTVFGKFWWEFLVGDTPELLVATAAVIGAALALRHHPTLGFVVVPVITALALVLSTYRGRGPRSE